MFVKNVKMYVANGIVEYVIDSKAASSILQRTTTSIMRKVQKNKYN